MTTHATVADLEAAALDDVSVDLGWSLIERFSTLVRESGSEDEHRAADLIAGELAGLGIEHEVLAPRLYLSLPRAGRVVWAGREATAKPQSFSVSTPGAGVTAPAVYLAAAPIEELAQLFDDRAAQGAVRGAIVVTDGYPMPATVSRFARAGAVGQVFINPGDNIHWGICTPIWGTPGDRDMARKPRTPVLAVNRTDGEAIKRHLDGDEPTLTLFAALEEGWYRCKLPVATIRGRADDFLLVHGHYDSWDVGVGDNAVGDAMLLELARIFHRQRHRLRRSLKVAWWPGHSTGRYAGSTWFADQFALELRKRCVAAVDIDSPGCAGATAFENVMWMAEADTLCRQAILDRTGQRATRSRPVRAGDYAFNQLGLTSFFMLLSSIPEPERKARGYYPVGGCGGNIAWHTEDDRLAVADRGILAQDLGVYVSALARVLNAELLPFDHRAAVAEMAAAIEDYRRLADGLIDLTPVVRELRGLESALDALYARLETHPESASVTGYNKTLKELARILVPINYARGRRFEHDPALPLGVLPALEDIAHLRRCRDHQPPRLPFLQTGIRRQVNRVANAFYEAAQLARRHA